MGVGVAAASGVAFIGVAAALAIRLGAGEALEKFLAPVPAVPRGAGAASGGGSASATNAVEEAPRPELGTDGQPPPREHREDGRGLPLREALRLALREALRLALREALPEVLPREVALVFPRAVRHHRLQRRARGLVHHGQGQVSIKRSPVSVEASHGLEGGTADGLPVGAAAVSEEGYREEFLNGSEGEIAKRISPDLWKLHWALTTPRRREIHIDVIASWWDNAAWFPRYQAYLRQHQPPTLIVWGPRDGYMPAGAARAYLRDLPDAQLHLLEDAGHWLLETHLEEAAAPMRAFLERVHDHL